MKHQGYSIVPGDIDVTALRVAGDNCFIELLFNYGKGYRVAIFGVPALIRLIESLYVEEGRATLMWTRDQNQRLEFTRHNGILYMTMIEDTEIALSMALDEFQIEDMLVTAKAALPPELPRVDLS